MTRSLDDLTSLTSAPSLADSDLIKIDVPDTPAELFPETVALTPAPAPVVVPPILIPPLEITREQPPYFTKPVTKRRGIAIDPDNWISAGINIGKYGAIATAVGGVSYAMISWVVGGVTGVYDTITSVDFSSVVVFAVFIALVVGGWKLAARVSHSSSSQTMSEKGYVQAVIKATKPATSPSKDGAGDVETKTKTKTKSKVKAKASTNTETNTETESRVSEKIRTKTKTLVKDDSDLDPDTVRWLEKMRDKDTGQSVGMWSGTHYDLIADAIYGGDVTTAITMHGNDRCAVGWALELDDPNGWPSKSNNGTKHSSYPKLIDKYGSKTIKSAIEMNDRGVLLRKIADYVEDRVRKGKK